MTNKPADNRILIVATVPETVEAFLLPQIAGAVMEAYARRHEMLSIGRRNRELAEEKYSWLCVARKVAAVLAGVPKDGYK